MDYCVIYYKFHIFILKKNNIFNEQEYLSAVEILGIKEDKNNAVTMATISHPSPNSSKEVTVLPIYP